MFSHEHQQVTYQMFNVWFLALWEFLLKLLIQKKTHKS